MKVWDYLNGGVPLSTCDFGTSITMISSHSDTSKVIIGFGMTIKIYDYMTCAIVQDVDVYGETKTVLEFFELTAGQTIVISYGADLVVADQSQSILAHYDLSSSLHYGMFSLLKISSTNFVIGIANG